SEPREQLNLALNSSWLAEVKIGNFVNIEQIYAPRTIIRQLKSLKFKPEQKVQLVSKSASGSVVVNINNSLIGMGAEIARRVVVTFVDEEK
ncbi:MAG: FeoA family protein, partial [Cyanobacteria bacterium J06600_6]